MKYDFNSLVTRLQSDVCLVTFTKVDGTERTMRCTLKPKYLPEEYRHLTSPMLTEQAPVTLSVWDCDANHWKSFRVDNVINVV